MHYAQCSSTINQRKCNNISNLVLFVRKLILKKEHKVCVITKYIGRYYTHMQKMHCFLEKITQLSKNFTRPPVVAVAPNFNSVQ